jgi:hypothetical protein
VERYGFHPWLRLLVVERNQCNRLRLLSANWHTIAIGNPGVLVIAVENLPGQTRRVETRVSRRGF